MECIFIIEGNIPSKKNQKRIITNKRTGKPQIISSKSFSDAYKPLCEQFKQQALVQFGTSEPKLSNVQIDVCFVSSTLHKWDLSNKLESVNDIMVDVGILEDDNRFVVKRQSQCSIFDVSIKPVQLITYVKIKQCDDVKFMDWMLS